MIDKTSFKCGEISARIKDFCKEATILHFDVEDADISELIRTAFEFKCITAISVTKCETNPACLVLHITKDICELEEA